MSKRSKYEDRLDQAVQRGTISQKQRRQAIREYDRRGADEREAVGDVVEGFLGFIWEALGLGRED